MVLDLSFHSGMAPSTGYEFTKVVLEYFMLGGWLSDVGVSCSFIGRFGVFSWKGARLLLTTSRLRAEILLRWQVFIKTFKSGTGF